jgi:hypothetical protein
MEPFANDRKKLTYWQFGVSGGARNRTRLKPDACQTTQ